MTTARSQGFHSRIRNAEWMCASQLCTFIALGLSRDLHAMGSDFIRCVVQASNKLGLVLSVIISLYKPWEVQKPPGVREVCRKEEQPITGIWVQTSWGSEAHKE